VSIKVEIQDKQLQDAIKAARSAVSDLTVPFKLMTDAWFRSNRAIFALKGPGKYADLSEAYKTQKKRRHGFTYPILRASGNLEDSITKPGDAGSIAQTLNKKTLILGTKVSYGQYLQFGTSRMPARPFILVGAEQVAPAEINRRRDAWVKMLQDYVMQKTGAVGGVA
jgi:phage gpG-like protein